MALLNPINPLDYAPGASGGPADQAGPSLLQAAQQQQTAGLQAQAAQLKVQEQQQTLQRQQAFRAAVAGVAKSPSAAAYTNILAQFPEFANDIEPFMKRLDATDKATLEKSRAGLASQLQPAFAAFAQNKPEVARPYLERLVKGLKNSNRADEAAEIQGVLSMDPALAQVALGGVLRRVMDEKPFEDFISGLSLSDKRRGEKGQADSLVAKGAADSSEKYGLLAENKSKIGQMDSAAFASRASGQKSLQDVRESRALLPGKIAEQDARQANLESEAEARDQRLINDLRMAPLERKMAQAKLDKLQYEVQNAPNAFELEKAKLEQTKERNRLLAMQEKRLKEKLPPAVITELNKMSGEITAAKTLSKDASNALKGLESITSSGIPGRISEEFKRWRGAEDGETRARQLSEKVRAGQALAILGPLKGSTSDKDLAFALEQFPKNTSNPEIMKSFLQGVKKLADMDTELKAAKQAWMTRNGGSLGPARDNVEIMGLDIQPGESFDVIENAIIAPYIGEPSAALGREKLAEVAALRARARGNAGAAPTGTDPMAAKRARIAELEAKAGRK